VLAVTPSAVPVTLVVCVVAPRLLLAFPARRSSDLELNVAVRTPVVGSVVPVAGVRVFPVPPVAVRLTLAPPIGLPFASRAVTVMVDEPPAGIDAGAAATVDCGADTGLTVTVTPAVCVVATVLIVAEIVFPPVVVELNVPVRPPFPTRRSPVPGVRVFPVPPVAVRLTLAPPIGLPFASRAVTVMVDEPPAGIDAGAAATV